MICLQVSIVKYKSGTEQGSAFHTQEDLNAYLKISVRVQDAEDYG
jgi:hypothetical protein